MTKINVLDPSIYNLINAGEVAVNPAGVIKELVENSLDAGATQISVEIGSEATEYIRVVDNGSGIENSQIENAFKAHATSKISKAEDIYNIETLGFRGEALASISNVSRLSILTKTESEQLGTFMSIEAGVITEKSEKPSNVGTDITIKNLFFNTPVRLKFLNTNNSEIREVSKTMENLMLSNPNIKFTYYIAGKLKFQTTGNGLEQTIYELGERDFYNASFKVVAENEKYKLVGYALEPGQEIRGKFTRCFVNNRVTLNQCMASAVQASYADYVMKGVIPSFILFLDLPYNEVDVNITPQKTDVKFQNDTEVYSFIYSNVKRCMLEYVARERYYRNEMKLLALLDRQIEEDAKGITNEKKQENKGVSAFARIREMASNIDCTGKTDVEDIKKEFKRAQEVVNMKMGKVNVDSFVSNEELSTTGDAGGVASDSEIMTKLKNFNANLAKQELSQKSFVDKTKVLGVVFETYILVQDDTCMYIIDQHACHERFLFDSYMEQINKSEVALQNLLVPYTINANYDLANFLEKNLKELKQLGFNIEFCGSNTFTVDEVPMILSDIDLSKFIDEIYANKNFVANSGEQLKEKIAMRACKNAIKAGMVLNDSEINKVLEMIKNSSSPLLCPHGRPYVLKITKKDIEKWFKRIV